ncbi:hypothetical protein DH2020_001151 [Rehmannia glutinosa]|uniref:Glycosyltransferase family 28 N-terminal domain-containing protein n=1 Tax=Rehmannia glutinosa TaxID=99300 RepID=A0ABR0XYI7_REHGL
MDHHRVLYAAHHLSAQLINHLCGHLRVICRFTEGCVDLDRTRSQPEEVGPQMAQTGEASSSSSSGEVSVQFEKDAPEVIATTSDSSAVAPLSNGGSSTSGSVGAKFSRVNTTPPGILDSEKLKPPLVLQRSKTERQRHNNILAEEAAQIFDNRISVQQKLQLLNRIATVKDDGTVEFEVPGDVEPQTFGGGAESVYSEVDEEPVDATELQYVPPLQIVMLIVGTRGDVQPFVAIGKRLQDYGHRVRLATHSNFKDFVLTSGLEFYPLGGDPKVLAGYMVKNKGFLPSGPSEIPIQRNQMKEIIYSLLPACKEPDIDSGISFKADAIIANPPAYGYITLLLSYQIVDSLIWLGIRDLINDVRKKKLKLRPVTYLSGSQGSEADIPHGYIWSPHLVPKPKDWGPKVDVVGFCFLDLATNYEPPESLLSWLKAGPKPIYIGFGSLPVQEPEKMTQIIVEALEITKQRGIINKGWGGLGDLAEEKDFVYLLDNCPHDWLFLQCAAVVHHGGAGTTAAGLKAAIDFSQVKERAIELAKAMENEDGVTGAVKAFLKHLPRKKNIEPGPQPTPLGWFCELYKHELGLNDKSLVHLLESGWESGSKTKNNPSCFSDAVFALEYEGIGIRGMIWNYRFGSTLMLGRLEIPNTIEQIIQK